MEALKETILKPDSIFKIGGCNEYHITFIIEGSRLGFRLNRDTLTMKFVDLYAKQEDNGPAVDHDFFLTNFYKMDVERLITGSKEEVMGYIKESLKSAVSASEELLEGLGYLIYNHLNTGLYIEALNKIKQETENGNKLN